MTLNAKGLAYARAAVEGKLYPNSVDESGECRDIAEVAIRAYLRTTGEDTGGMAWQTRLKPSGAKHWGDWHFGKMTADRHGWDVEERALYADPTDGSVVSAFKSEAERLSGLLIERETELAQAKRERDEWQDARNRKATRIDHLEDLIDFLRSKVEEAEAERAAQWRKRRDAEGSRDAAMAACDSMRLEKEEAEAERNELKASRDRSLEKLLDTARKLDAAERKVEELCHAAFVDGYASADGHGTAPWGTSETKADLDRDFAQVKP